MATPINNIKTVPHDIIEEAYSPVENEVKETLNKSIEKTSLENPDDLKSNFSTQPEKNAIVEQILPSQKKKRTEIHTLELSSRDRNAINVEARMHAYNFDIHLGQYEENGISTTDGIPNINSVVLNHVILPNIEDNLSRYPYLYIEIPQLPGKYIGTSQHSTRTFAKVVRDKDWAETQSSNISYFCMYDKFGVGWNSEVPIALLSHLTIRVLSPRGELIPHIQDTFEISQLTLNATTLDIEFNLYFQSSQLNTDHIITFHNISSTSGQLKDFLERKDGHVVQNVDLATKTIQISLPSDFDNTTNTSTYQLFGLTSGTILNPSGGVVLNSSLQTSLSLNCIRETYENPNESVII